MRFLIPLLFLLCVLSPAHAQDADTLTVNGTSIVDGIDAPEPDQPCLDEEGIVYPCGQVAYEVLQDFIADRAVTCEDLCPDTKYEGRTIGLCTVDGVDLHRWLVRKGWALNFEPYARGRFKDDERYAREHDLGMWKGCFATPRDFRHWKNKEPPFGASCPADARARLFRAHAEMPEGCEIKGKYAVRAKLTGHVGIYHVPGCGSYRRTTHVDRWFCSEEEAIAAGFRRSYIRVGSNNPAPTYCTRRPRTITR